MVILRSKALSTVLALLFIAGTMAAKNVYAIPLLDLVNGGSITVDDKLFNNFQIEFDAGSKAVDLANIEVTGLDGQPLNPGLKFTAQNDALSVDFGDFIHFAFIFKVTVLDPRFYIKDASISLTDFLLDALGDGVITIDDLVLDPNFNNLASLAVDADPAFGNLFDSDEFARQNMVYQEIDIFIDSGFFGDPTGIFMFEIRKSQIPEPALILLILSSFGFLTVWFKKGIFFS